MRDINRIDKCLDTIRKIWTANPDLRLMQLLINATGDGPASYYMEDDIVLDRLAKVYNINDNNESRTTKVVAVDGDTVKVGQDETFYARVDISLFDFVPEVGDTIEICHDENDKLVIVKR